MSRVDAEARRQYMRDRYKRTSTQRKAEVAAYRKKNPEKVKAMLYAWNLRQYGLTPETKVAMAKRQKFKCLICFKKVSLVVDHCHNTGKVRGLLCALCNRMLGLYEKEKALGRFDHYLEGFSA